MSLRAALPIAIDTFRLLAVLLTVPTLGFAAIVGFAAYADYDSRECFVDSAMQCSDASATIAYAIALAASGPMIVAALTIVRKLVAFREGAHHA